MMEDLGPYLPNIFFFINSSHGGGVGRSSLGLPGDRVFFSLYCCPNLSRPCSAFIFPSGRNIQATYKCGLFQNSRGRERFNCTLPTPWSQVRPGHRMTLLTRFIHWPPVQMCCLSMSSLWGFPEQVATQWCSCELILQEIALTSKGTCLRSRSWSWEELCESRFSASFKGGVYRLLFHRQSEKFQEQADEKNKLWTCHFDYQLLSPGCFTFSLGI